MRLQAYFVRFGVLLVLVAVGVLGFSASAYAGETKGPAGRGLGDVRGDGFIGVAILFFGKPRIATCARPGVAHVVRLGALMAGLLIILAAVATDSFASRSASTTPASVAANPLAIQNPND